MSPTKVGKTPKKSSVVFDKIEEKDEFKKKNTPNNNKKSLKQE